MIVLFYLLHVQHRGSKANDTKGLMLDGLVKSKSEHIYCQ